MRALTGILALWLTLCAGTAAAGKPVEPSSWSAGLPLRWDNIEGAPYQVDGPPLRYSLEHGMHLCEIQTGDSVKVKLGANTLFRIHSPGRLLDTDDLEAWVSNGSGVQVSTKLNSSRGTDLLLRSHPWRTSLVELIRPGDAAGPVRVALFVSRIHRPDRAALLGTVVEFPAGATWISPADVFPFFRPVETYWHQVPGGRERQEVVVDGPARLLLRTRLAYPAGETRRRQSYRVRIRVDGNARDLLLDTVPDSSGLFLVDSARTLLGAERDVHLELESGSHRLSVEADPGVYWRLLLGSDRDYLLETPPRVQVLPPPFPALSGTSEPGLAGPPEPAASPGGPRLPTTPAAPGSATDTIEALRRDVGWRRDAGLLASMYARGLTKPIYSYPDERASAGVVRSRLTQYRNLQPWTSRTDAPRVAGAFGARRLLEPLRDVSEIHLSRQRLDDVLDNYSVAAFETVSEVEKEALLFRLPELLSPSLLRVVVAHPSFSSKLVAIRLDERPPVLLRVLPGPELPAAHYSPLPFEVGLAAALSEDPEDEPLGAILSRPEPALRWLDVGVVELDLPQGVRAVRLWGVGGGIPPLVALQYLGERSFALTEREYLNAWSVRNPPEEGANAPPDHPLVEDFRRWRQQGDADDLRADPLLRHRLSMLRGLRRMCDRVDSGTVPGWEPDEEPTATEIAAARASEAEALRLEAEGEWLLALEEWGTVLEGCDAELRARARSRRVVLLERLGEWYLAERQLRGLWRYAPDPELRRSAFERLLELYEVPGEEEELLDLVAVAAMESADPALLTRLSELLADAGSHLMALDVALGFPPEERPLEVILRSAWNLGWWKTFDDAALRLRAIQARWYWAGLRLLSEKRYPEAIRELARAGGRGKALAACVREALEIREALRDPDPEARCRAILRWESWQDSDPGPWRWVKDESLVVAHGGGDACRSLARNTFERYHRTRKGRPVVVEVQGPARLRLEARPIHPKDSRAGLDSWLMIRATGLEFPVAITGNLQARGLVLLNAVDESPGTRVTRTLALGPGRHRLEVSSPGPDVLVRFLIREREMTAGLLPRLTPWSLAAIVAGGPGLRVGPAGNFPSKVRFHRDREGREQIVVQVSAVGEDPRLPSPSLPDRFDSELAARMALRLGNRGLLAKHSPGLRGLVTGGKGIGDEERFLARAWLADLHESGEEPPRVPEWLPEHLLEPFLLHAGRSEEIVELPWSGDEDSLLRQMEYLLRVAETSLELSERARVRGEELFLSHRLSRGLKPLHSRLVRRTTWERVTGLRDSAGNRRVPVIGWHPEFPGLRVRKALLARFEDDERLLAGDGTIGLFLRSEEPTDLRLNLRLEPLEFLPSGPVTVLHGVDDEDPTELALRPENPTASVTIPVPAGEHSVRLRMKEPVVNQFLRVRWVDEGQGEVRATETGEEDDADALLSRRRYAVATQERPVQVALEGPASLRVDELRGTRTSSRYLQLPPGLQELTLEPREQSDEALIRIFRRVPAADKVPLLPWRPLEPVREVPPATFRLELPATPETAHMDDTYPLGGQEDGTLSLTASLHRRRVFEEDDLTDDDYDQYLELRPAYRCWLPHGKAHFESALLTRAHEDAGPTLGIEEDIHWSPEWLPFTLRLRGTAYIQWPEGPMALPEGPSEWSASLKGTASRYTRLGLNAYHVPAVSVFGRHISLDDASDYPDDVIDQDVFTPYKRDHQAGFVISETVGYRPWLDTEWWAGASLTSNENFNPGDPDHVSGRVGWRQFLWGWRLDAGYRVTRFFDDGDRNDGSTRQAVSADLFRDFWVTPRSRLEIGFEYRHDFPDNEDAGFVSITWHFSNGRGLRDFWPSRSDFRNLREAYVPEHYNNSIGGAPRE